MEKLLCYNGNIKNSVVNAVYKLIDFDETIHNNVELTTDLISKGEYYGYEETDIIELLENNISNDGYVLQRYGDGDFEIIAKYEKNRASDEVDRKKSFRTRFSNGNEENLRNG